MSIVDLRSIHFTVCDYFCYILFEFHYFLKPILQLLLQSRCTDYLIECFRIILNKYILKFILVHPFESGLLLAQLVL